MVCLLDLHGGSACQREEDRDTGIADAAPLTGYSLLVISDAVLLVSLADLLVGNATGMRNPRVNVTGCSGVRVRVAKFVPSENPYLCHGLPRVDRSSNSTRNDINTGFSSPSSTPLPPKTMFSTPGRRRTKVRLQLFI